MAQVTTGIRGMFSNPSIYGAFQNLMGAHNLRRSFVNEFVRPFPGCLVLDIGCGPADILAYLPDVNFWGYDISAAYIAKASKRFGQRGRFHCRQLSREDVESMPRFDIALALGVLHHLDDKSAIGVLSLASQALKPGGRMLTFDPCLDVQSPFARFLIKMDRGQNVRSKAGYTSIASAVFESPRVEVRHKVWIPYTHCFMECTRT